MDAIKEYFSAVRDILDKVEKTQYEKMKEAANIICKASLENKNIFAFGCSHGSLLALELYYRTGGMATINPIRAPGLNLDVDPASLTSQIECLPEYGRLIIDSQPIKAGDVLVVHSVSGRNTVIIDVAERAQEIGVYVVALTGLEASFSLKSRHPSGKSLRDVSDLVIDNCGCLGDAVLEIPNVPTKVAPTSTAVGAAILNAVMVQAVYQIAEAEGFAPVFVSGNLDHGTEYNKKIFARYGDRIFYMGHKDYSNI